MVSRGWRFYELFIQGTGNSKNWMSLTREVFCFVHLFLKKNRLFKKHIRGRTQFDRGRSCFLVLTFPQLDYCGRMLTNVHVAIPFSHLTYEHQNKFLKVPTSLCSKGQCFNPDSNYQAVICNNRCPTGNTKQMMDRPALQKDQAHSVCSQLLMKLSQPLRHMFLYFNLLPYFPPKQFCS